MEETKRCPYCGEEILAVAKKCKHCGEWLEKKEPAKEKKACPICGELVDADLDICPYCNEPINDMINTEVIPEPINQKPLPPINDVLKAEPYKNYVKLAFGAVVLGTFLSYAADFAELYPFEESGLIELLIGLGRSIPSWVGVCLSGIGSIYLLWNAADLIGLQKKAEGRDDDITSFFLKVLSILYVSSGIIGCFAQEGVIAGVGIILLVLTGILLAINGFFLKSEKDSTLAGMGNAFIGIIFIAIWMFRVSSKIGPDANSFLWLAFIGYVAWIYAMFSAHKYLLKRNK